MKMKRALIIAGIAVFLLAAGVAVYFSLGPYLAGVVNDIPAKASPEAGGEQDTSAIQGNNPETSPQPDTESQTAEPVKTEEVKVENNSPEYDVKVTLVEDGSKQTSIKLEYYYEGAGTENTLDSTEIPEIDGIFEKRAENAENQAGFRIKGIWLNVKLSKLFMMINAEANNDMANTSLYSISLPDVSVKKLKSEFGKFGDISFSKDYKYLAYSFADNPAGSRLQESELLDVIDCGSDEFIVRNSRDKNEKKIGANIKSGTVYDYTFVSWNANNLVRLKQRPLDGKGAAQEVLYDISRNLILNLDGSVMGEAKPIQTPAGTEAPPAASGASKTLKDFYAYLASEKDYSKAMELLDENFTLKLEMIKQFGIDALHKSDINEENASVYSDLLKAAKLDAVVKEDSKDGEAVIYYYQVMDLNSGTQIKQPMSAAMTKTGDGWRITLIQDADGNAKPFASQ